MNTIVCGPEDAILCPIPQYPLYSAAIALHGASRGPEGCRPASAAPTVSAALACLTHTCLLPRHQPERMWLRPLLTPPSGATLVPYYLDEQKGWAGSLEDLQVRGDALLACKLAFSACCTVKRDGLLEACVRRRAPCARAGQRLSRNWRCGAAAGTSKPSKARSLAARPLPKSASSSVLETVSQSASSCPPVGSQAALDGVRAAGKRVRALVVINPVSCKWGERQVGSPCAAQRQH